MEPEVFEIKRANPSKIEFENVTQSSFLREKKLSWMMQLLVDNSGGKIHNKTQAGYVLMAVAFLFFALSLFFTIRALSSPSQPDPKNIIQVAGPDQIRQK